jgi:sirohydrochlorin ferrochelatase
MSTNDAARQVILVLGHGSRRGSSTDNGIREIAHRLQERFPAKLLIRPTFFEFLSPSLPESVEQAVAEGRTEIAVIPYFLFAGKEIKLEIPEQLEQLRQRFPQATIRQMGHIGVDARMARLAADRVRAALLGASQYLPAQGLVRRNAGGRLGVALVNRGSRARWDAGADLATMADMVRDELGGDTLATYAQAENSPRTIEVACTELAAQGARRIVVVPYLHFVGKVLGVNVTPAVERARLAHPQVQLCLSWAICVNNTTVDILEDRVRDTGFAGVNRGAENGGA